MRLLVMTLLLATCCGSGHYIVKEDDGRFFRYRSFFEKHTGHRTSYIPISYGKDDEGAVASCRYYNIGGRMHHKHIVVVASKFDSLTTNWKRAIIAHELIHCHLEHTWHTNTEELSIMNAQLPTDLPLTTSHLVYLLEDYRR